MIKGKNLILSLNGTAIAAAKNGSIAVDTSFINVCSPISGAWEEVLPTVHKWSASSDGLVSDPQYIDSLLQMQINKTPLTLRFSMGGAGNRQGTCYIAHIEQTGSVGNLAKYSIQLQGSGALTNAGLSLTFTKAESDAGLHVSSSALTIVSDDDDQIDYAEIVSTTPFRVQFTGMVRWAILPGQHSDWEQELSDHDGHQQMDFASQGSRGVGGISNVYAPGKYVVYASDYESRITAEVMK